MLILIHCLYPVALPAKKISGPANINGGRPILLEWFAFFVIKSYIYIYTFVFTLISIARFFILSSPLYNQILKFRADLLCFSCVFRVFLNKIREWKDSSRTFSTRGKEDSNLQGRFWRPVVYQLTNSPQLICAGLETSGLAINRHSVPKNLPIPT